MSAQAERSTCPNCGGGWTFDFKQKRVYCRQCDGRGRYCGPCDKWVSSKQTVCKACGADTEKAQ
jgi:hypothetical protein